MKKKYYKEILIFLGFILLTLIITYPVIFKMNTSVYGPLYGTDNRAVIWDFWRMKYNWQHHLPFKFISIIAYPFGIDLSISPYPSISNFCYKWLTVLTNEIFTYNLLLLLSFFLSGIFVYYLVYQFTKNKIASIISGIIFAFSPYHFNKVWEHFSLAQTQWIPLYVLTLLILRKKPIFKNVLFVALAFTLLMSFDFYYAYIMSIFTLGFIVFILLYKWRDKIKSQATSHESQVTRSPWRVIKMTIIAMSLAILINLPMLYPVFKTTFFVPKTDIAIANIYVRSFHYLFTHSARPLSYLLPASAHPIFGNFTKSMFGSIFYGRGSIEQTLYLGWLPLILSFIAFRKWKKNRKLRTTNYQLQTNRDDFIIGFFIFSGILAFLFSLPPYINLGLFKIYFPSFFMYKILPMLRAYARFGILVMLCVSVLAGFGVKFILERLKFSKKIILASIFLIIILFEFNNIPPFRVVNLESRIPKVYSWLANKEGDFAIAEYPMGEAGPGEAFMIYDYLLYQRIHQKKLINGAQLGTHAYKVKEKIMKISQLQTPGILKWLGAKYVIVHLDRYLTGVRGGVDIIGDVPDLSRQRGLKLVKKFDNVEVYEVKAKPIEPQVD